MVVSGVTEVEDTPEVVGGEPDVAVDVEAGADVGADVDAGVDVGGLADPPEPHAAGTQHTATRTAHRRHTVVMSRR